MDKVRLALIGTDGIPARYGGGETLYENLARGLSSTYDITVYCSKTQPRDKVGDTYLGARLKYLPLKGNGWQSVIYDTVSVIHAARHSDLLYIFGPGPAFIIRLLRFFGFKKKIFMNCGGVNEWEREKFSPLAKAYLKRGFKTLVGKVVFIADNELYARNLKAEFGVEDVLVIRYGGDNAVRVDPDRELLAKYPFLNDEYYVSVSRAQVDNNLHMVLEAFAAMPDKKLVLVSNFKVSRYGQDLFEKYKSYDNLILIPGIYDQRELNAVRSNALAYIHSHSRCGTPPSLCEAMNLGLPIISFDVEVNHEVTADKAVFFSSSDELKAVVGRLSGAELDKLAAASYSRALQELTWDHIWSQYKELFML